MCSRRVAGDFARATPGLKCEKSRARHGNVAGALHRALVARRQFVFAPRLLDRIGIFAGSFARAIALATHWTVAAAARGEPSLLQPRRGDRLRLDLRGSLVFPPRRDKAAATLSEHCRELGEIKQTEQCNMAKRSEKAALKSFWEDITRRLMQTAPQMSLRVLSLLRSVPLQPCNESTMFRDEVVVISERFLDVALLGYCRFAAHNVYAGDASAARAHERWRHRTGCSLLNLQQRAATSLHLFSLDILMDPSVIEFSSHYACPSFNFRFSDYKCMCLSKSVAEQSFSFFFACRAALFARMK